MRSIEIATSIARGADVFLNLICQSTAQLEDTYGRAGYQALMGNCRIKQMLGCADMHMAREISDLLGQATVRTKSESHNRGSRGGSEGETESWTGCPLMTPGEIMSMDREDQLIIGTGLDPVRAFKIHYFNMAPARDFLTPELQRDAPIWLDRAQSPCPALSTRQPPLSSKR